MTSPRQHGCATPPQAAQVPSLLQTWPSAQRWPAQQVWPGPPHSEQVLALAQTLEVPQPVPTDLQVLLDSEQQPVVQVLPSQQA
jgi:hypothetical protein